MTTHPEYRECPNIVERKKKELRDMLDKIIEQLKLQWPAQPKTTTLSVGVGEPMEYKESYPEIPLHSDSFPLPKVPLSTLTGHIKDAHTGTKVEE